MYESLHETDDRTTHIAAQSKILDFDESIPIL